jgi:Kef-type K+ transport system membrane component KefB
MEIFLLAAVTCLVVITIGSLINKYLRLPWMFTVVILGMTFSALGWFTDVLHSENFQFLARLGMLFFLFTIGIDLDFSQIRKLGKHIIIGDILLTLIEGLLLGLFFFFVFPDFVSHSFGIAFLAGVAFGTVGEVILLALLKEFGLEKTRFGQLALGIGVFDDIFEILALAVIVSLPALKTQTSLSTSTKASLSIVVTLFLVLLTTSILFVVGKYIRGFLEKVKANSFVIPFAIFMIVFAFIYFTSTGNENLGVIAAIFSGVAVQQVIPEKSLEQYKKPIFFFANMFLGPFFFLSLGGKMSLEALMSYPLLVISIMAISISVRVILSYFLFRGILGKRQSLVMGIGLTAKFSTSVISENLLFTSGMIAAPLYSAMMAAFIALKPIIVGAFSSLLAKHKEIIK